MTDPKEIPEIIFDGTETTYNDVVKETDKAITVASDTTKEALNYFVDKILGWFGP